MTQQEIEKLFKMYYTRMYRLAVSILYDEDESKDVVSEVFSRLISNDISLRPETTEAYLLMSVRNHCRNVLERKQVRERFLHLQSEDFCESMPSDAEQLRMSELMQIDKQYVAGTYNRFPVQIVSGKGSLVYDENGKEYYAYVAKYPMADEYALYGNMFAVSANTKNSEACMQIITLINTDSEVRNLLQYGIENVNYAIDEDTGVLHRLNQSYMMDIVKTGNCYIAYPEEGLPADYWEDAKVQSNQTLIDPLLGFDYNSRLAEYGYVLDNEQMDWAAQLAATNLAQIEACTDYDDLSSLIENIGLAMDNEIIEITIINQKGQEQAAILNIAKLTNKAYDSSTGVDGEMDPGGESPYTIYYSWLTEFGYLAPEEIQ